MQVDLIFKENTFSHLTKNAAWMKNFSYKAYYRNSTQIPAFVAKEIVKALQAYTTLSHVNLYGCCLEGESGSTILRGLNHKQLLSLNLDVNNLHTTPEDIRALLECILTNSGLRSLTLDNNFMMEDVFTSLIPALSMHKSLQTLKLNCVCLEASMVPFAQSLHTNTVLKNLYLYGTNLQASAIQALAKLLMHNKTLEYVDCRGNKIDDEGALELARAFVGSSLKSFNIDFSYLIFGNYFGNSESNKNR